MHMVLTSTVAKMNNYDYLDEMYENAPSVGKMRSSREPQVNNRMSTLKRAEDKLNRYRNDGLLG
jgi:hypothetical protein